MATANNLGTAYIKIAPQMQGVQATIQRALGTAGTEGGESFNKSFSLKAGALAGAISAVTSKAINAISSQFDNAIRRVDTLNVFPKIMQNLGYETDESTRSLDRLSARIEGLPTTLDEIVTYTQRLASSLDSLADEEMNATDLALAFNDAALSGGKGQYEANRAFEQYVQIIGRGRPMMQDWKIMLEVMPGQLKQIARYMGENNKSLQEYAKAAGKTVAQLDGMDLYEWISEDKNAYAKERLADFNRALITLDKEGGAGITSFKEQVGDATHTIGTAMRLIGVRISKALATVIQAFGAKDIYEAIDNFTKSFKGIGEWVAQYVVPPLKNEVFPAIGNVLKVIKDVVQFISTNQTARTALKIMLESFIAFKVVAPIIGGIVSALGMLTGGLTAAQAATGWLGLAITGVVAAIETFNATAAAFNQVHELAANLAEYNARQLTNEYTALTNLNRARENEKKILQDLDAAKKLQNDAEYQELVAKQNLAAAEEAYNAILADTNATADQKRMKQLELKAAEDAYTEAIEKRKQAVKATNELDREYRDGQYTALHETNSVINAKILEAQQYGTLAKRLDELKTKQIEYTDAQGITHRFSKERMNDIANWYAERLGKNDETWRQIVEYAEKNQISFVEACERAGWHGGEQFDLRFAAGIDEYADYALDATHTSIDLVTKEIEWGLNPMNKHWAEALANCRKLGINVMGALDDGMKSQISRINDTMTRVFGTGIPNALKQVWQIHSPSRVFMNIGQQVGAGLVEGIDSYTDRVEAKATELADSVVSPFNKEAQLDLSANGNARVSRSPIFSPERYSSGASVVQNNIFNQVADDLDVKEASKLLGFEVATAI